MKRIEERADRDLAAVLLRALAHHPKDRYLGAHEFGMDLRRWLRGEPVLARPLSVGTRIRRWCVRHPVRTVAASAALTVVMGVAWSGVQVSEARSKEAQAIATEAFARSEAYANIGRWDEALQSLDVAARGHGDPIRIELERAQILQAKLEVEGSRECLARLRLRDDLGARRDLVELLWFDPTIPRASEDAETEGDDWRSVFGTLSESPHLSDAWRAYARACLAPSFGGCRRELREAIQLDRYHRYAHELAVAVAIFSGSEERALAAAEAFSLRWPEDSTASDVGKLVPLMAAGIDESASDRISREASSLAQIHEIVRTLGRLVRNQQLGYIVGVKPGLKGKLSVMAAGHKAVSAARSWLEGSLRIPPVLLDAQRDQTVQATIETVVSGGGLGALKPALDESLPNLARRLDLPTLRLTSCLLDATNGRVDVALAAVRECQGEQDWMSSPSGIRMWQVLVLSAAFSTSSNRLEPLPSDLEKELAAAVRAALQDSDEVSAMEAAALTAAAIVCHDKSLMRRCAGWSLDLHADKPLAVRLAGAAYGYAGDREIALRLLDSLPESELSKCVKLRENLAAGPLEPLLFNGPGQR